MNKIPIAEFMTLTGKKKYQVHYLFSVHPKLKVKIDGEKSCRVNMDEWSKILKRA